MKGILQYRGKKANLGSKNFMLKNEYKRLYHKSSVFVINAGSGIWNKLNSRKSQWVVIILPAVTEVTAGF